MGEKNFALDRERPAGGGDGEIVKFHSGAFPIIVIIVPVPRRPQSYNLISERTRNSGEEVSNS